MSKATVISEVIKQISTDYARSLHTTHHEVKAGVVYFAA